jgi:hypothetical protein
VVNEDHSSASPCPNQIPTVFPIDLPHTHNPKAMLEQTSTQKKITASKSHAMELIILLGTFALCMTLAIWQVLLWENSVSLLLATSVCLLIGKRFTIVAVTAAALYLLFKITTGIEGFVFQDQFPGILSVIVYLAAIFYGFKLFFRTNDAH